MNRLRRLFHRHRWETLAVTLGTNILGGAVTLILRKCETCPEHDTENVNGHWPVELFMPPANQGE